MTLRGRIPVEPLDDERLTNIERRVVAGAADAAARGQRQGDAHRLTGRVVMAAAMVAAGAIGWLLHRAPGAPEAMAVAEPAAVHLETTAQRALLDIGDARIASDPATVFSVTRPAGGVLVAMTRGRVELDVDKRHGRPPLVVRAGDTDVVVVGTHFTVDCGDGHGEVAVQVTEGVVRIVHLQQETRVAAGQAWQTHGGLLAAAGGGRPGRAGEPDDAAHTGQLAGSAASDRGEATGREGAGRDGDAVRDGDPARLHAGSAIALGQAPDVLHDRKAAVPVAAPGATAPPAPVRLATAPGRPLGSDAVRAHAAAQASDGHVDLTAAIRAQRVEPALDIGEPDAASAVAKYYAIAAHTSGEDASQAFYSIAVIRHTRLGRNADALQALDAYVRRFPAGKQYRAVLWLRVRILCLDKIDDRCRAAAYTYLHEAPDDPAAHVAELVTLTE